MKGFQLAMLGTTVNKKTSVKKFRNYLKRKGGTTLEMILVVRERSYIDLGVKTRVRIPYQHYFKLGNAIFAKELLGLC